MSEIENIQKNLSGTRESEILSEMEKVYENITVAQKEWYDKTDFFCVNGCGECCRNFEPDLLEGEVLYMAAWILENEPEVAAKLIEGKFPFERSAGCQFWDESKEYHCTIYGGRPLICRFFGACGSYGKTGEVVFKPCKFYPIKELQARAIPLSHRQYSQKEIMEIFGTLPPVMSDLAKNVTSFSPDNQETKLIREILPDTIRRLKWIISMNS